MDWNEKTAKRPRSSNDSVDPGLEMRVQRVKLIQREYYVASKINLIMLSLLESHKLEDVQ